MPRGQLRPDRHACKHARCRESFCGGPRSGSGNPGQRYWRDRKSTRLNSSHSQISYAVFCLKKKIMDIDPEKLDLIAVAGSADKKAIAWLWGIYCKNLTERVGDADEVKCEQYKSDKVAEAY